MSTPSFSMVVQNSTATRFPSTSGRPIRTEMSRWVAVTPDQYDRTPSRPACGSSKMLER